MLRALVIFSVVSLSSAVPREKDTCGPDRITVYKTSDTAKQSCRNCLCGSEIRSFCEDVKCFPSNGTKRVTLKDSCDHHMGLHKESEGFMYYCNECICNGNDSVRCTNKSCDLDIRANDVSDQSSNCKYKGRTIPLARNFFDGCNHCYCSVFGQVTCLLRPCQPYKWLLRIEDSCEYNGFFYSKDQEFLDEDCQSCTCVGNDRLICTTMLCNKREDFYAVNPDHQTDTGDDDCNYKGKMYKVGVNFTEYCNSCLCTLKYGVICTQRSCNISTYADINGGEYECNYKGKMHKHGPYFRDACNECTCTSMYGVFCTQSSCRIHVGLRLRPDHYSCYYEQHRYRHDEKFTEDCNVCFCTSHSDVMCTQLLCHVPPVPELKEGGYECYYKGKVYKEVDIFSDDCNLCFCVTKYGILCTQKSCPNPELKEGDEYDCAYNGKKYKKDEKFADDCNVCFCISRNHVICTEKWCKLPWIHNLRAGFINGCYCNRTMYNIGETVTQGDCTVCTCEGVNAFICREVWCKGYQKTDGPRDKDICSPDGIVYKSSKYNIRWCRTCLCVGGLRYYCENVKCFPSNGTVRLSLKDSCFYKGRLLEKAELFLDYCSTCLCKGNDDVHCTNMSCALHIETQELGSDCEYKGSSYKRGQAFLYGCNECYCPLVGDVHCLPKSCPSYRHILRIVDSCEYNGFFLSKDEDFIDENCQECKCLGNDTFICQRISCTYWAASYPVDPLTAFCGTDGKVYEIIDKITNDGSNVTIVERRRLLIA